MEHQTREFETLSQLLADLRAEGITGIEKKKQMDRFLSLRARKYKIPITGAFELTPLCNLDCKMCYVHLNKLQAGTRPLLTAAQWIEIARQAISAGMMKVDLTGGECLTHPGFREIYEFLISNGIQVSILTNGVLLTREMVDFLKVSPPSIVQISVYGSSTEAYCRVTGHDVFDTVMSNIDRLKEAGINTSLTITPSRYMKDDARALLELVHSKKLKYGINGITLPAVQETGRLMDEYAADHETFSNLFRWKKELHANNVPDAMPESKPYRFNVKGLTSGNGIPCASGQSSFHINWKGEITPCIPFSGICFPVLELGFNQAWNCIVAEIAKYTELEECRNCELREMCVTCPAEKRFGRLDGPLNRRVCERLRAYLDAGIIKQIDSTNC